MSNQKVALGKFYTAINPFSGQAWNKFKSIINNGEVILEPFAGSNNIPKMLNNLSWKSYDILPESSNIIKQDTLKNFPKGFRVCITNPPYLDVRTARKKKIQYNSNHSDLYLESIEKMLDNCDYVAAIIPSTFYNKKVFKDRLWMWDKIDRQIFTDTGMSVGVAYFGPNVYNTELYLNGSSVPSNSDFKDNKTEFNTSQANLSACLIDSTSQKTIEVRDLSNFNFKKYLKPLSRYYVAFKDERISVKDINDLNNFISDWRNNTNDFWLTPFKSTLPNGTYRKRLGFKQLSGLISAFLEERNSNEQ
tara:strand:- start:543 stop:1457 length:915 start_codon:yes stop_codon:yes gene_type:complete